MTISVFDYGDYRTFLKDFYHAKKEQLGWSLKVWARTLGISSPSTLHMIMKGERHAGRQLTQRLLNYFKFPPKEAEHFSNLVRLGKCANDVRMSLILMEQLAKNCKRGTFMRLSHEKMETLSHWHYYAIRELVGLPGFRENAHWISQQCHFPLTPRQFTEAVEILLSAGLLQRDKRGKLKVTSEHVDTPSDFAAEGIKRFHEETLENAKLSLRKVAPAERELQGTTFAVLSKDMGKAKELIRKFQTDFCDILERSDGDSVYHIEIAFFPLISLAKKETVDAR